MFDIKTAGNVILNRIKEYQLFDFYRIVDVDSYAVYDIQEDALLSADHKCYDIWCRNEPCANCTSVACLHRQHEIVKLECLDGKIYWIVSLPFPELGENMALELIKDVTDILYINDRYHPMNESFTDILTQIENTAVKDPYTGLFGKRYMQHEVEKHLQDDLPVSLVLLDLDKFKQVNDIHGHLCGDEVILFLSGMLKDYQYSDTCQVGRIGGDEFLILYKDKSKEYILHEVQTLCEEFALHTFKNRRQEQFHVSVSAGIAYSEKGDSWENLFSRVDESMYDSKAEKKCCDRASSI